MRKCWTWLVVASLCLASPAAEAKTYRYDGGPQAPADTTLSVAVFVADVSETKADLRQVYERENGHRSRDAHRSK